MYDRTCSKFLFKDRSFDTSDYFCVDTTMIDDKSDDRVK